jgi:UDP-GlcNAc:undecaprenyl-phosphate GlcNAc-1-phosphate transferase
MLGPNKTAILWLVGALWLAVLPPLVGMLLKRLGMVKPNFRGEPIPVGYGLVILFWSAPALAGLAYLIPLQRRILAAYFCVVTGMALLGFIDDRWGNRTVTGLKGHIRKFIIEGEITTGFVKAFGGLLLGFLVPRVILAQPWQEALLNGFIIALSANLFNLFDLRPGRAGALFLLSASCLTTATYLRRADPFIPPLVFVLLSALVVYERDARARVMLGDTGSNLLGGALGLSFILAFPLLPARIVLLTALVVFHLIAERYSLTKLIEQNAVLRRLDRMTGKR